MANPAIYVSVELTEFSCGQCGGVYAINERVRLKHHENGTGWHCPYCECSWGYFKNGKVQELERQLEAERQRKLDALSRLNDAEQGKAKAERKLKRVQRGVCPCCNRTFTNLARHMESKHPDGTVVARVGPKPLPK